MSSGQWWMRSKVASLESSAVTFHKCDIIGHKVATCDKAPRGTQCVSLLRTASTKWAYIVDD